jgi:hypothetical protein
MGVILGVILGVICSRAGSQTYKRSTPKLRQLRDITQSFRLLAGECQRLSR